jgi:hypothetical protein
MRKESMKLRTRPGGREPKTKSEGTLIAEKARVRGNQLSDAARSAYLKDGLAMIYGGGLNAKTTVNCR